MKHPISVDGLSDQVKKVCGPGAPAMLKEMAAGGRAPLGPNDLVTALYFLSYDESSQICELARSTISGLPPSVLVGALAQLGNDGVLDGLAQRLISRPQAIETIVLNPALAPETALWVARNALSEGVCEIIAGNESLLLTQPAIIEALYNNKRTRMSTADRVVEFAVRNQLELTGIACFQEVKAAITGELIFESSEEPTPEDLQFAENLDKASLTELDEAKVAEALDGRSDETESTEEEKQVESLQQSLSNMTISAKIRVATLGSGTQRAILIRDSNKLVAMAVVKSPGIKESEVMQYSRYRSLPEEAIRYMASNREWTKHYGVKLNLVQNPRCPLEIALRYMNFLRVNDVKALERDRNIPQAVANAARQLRNKRMK